YLSPEQEEELLDQHLNRVTDTCIPEFEAIRRIDGAVLEESQREGDARQQIFPHDFMYKILLSGVLEQHYQIDAKDSWLLAAAEADLPMFVPGWEDSTLGNIFAGHCIAGDIDNVHTVRTGIEYMMILADWYQTTCRKGSIGFFQIGGGIAGDFSICVGAIVPQHLPLPDQ